MLMIYWSADVCLSDLAGAIAGTEKPRPCGRIDRPAARRWRAAAACPCDPVARAAGGMAASGPCDAPAGHRRTVGRAMGHEDGRSRRGGLERAAADRSRSEEHTSELQSLLRTSY